MTSAGGPAGDRPAGTSSRRAPTWPRVAVVAGVIVLAFIVSRATESDVTQEEAVAKATELVDFVPEDTQVRLLRQGLDRHPFWIVSLSIPKPGGGAYSELAVVRIDADSGKVVEFREQKNAKRSKDEAP